MFQKLTYITYKYVQDKYYFIITDDNIEYNVSVDAFKSELRIFHSIQVLIDFYQIKDNRHVVNAIAIFYINKLLDKNPSNRFQYDNFLRSLLVDMAQQANSLYLHTNNNNYKINYYECVKNKMRQLSFGKHF